MPESLSDDKKNQQIVGLVKANQALAYFCQDHVGHQDDRMHGTLKAVHFQEALIAFALSLTMSCS